MDLWQNCHDCDRPFLSDLKIVFILAFVNRLGLFECFTLFTCSKKEGKCFRNYNLKYFTNKNIDRLVLIVKI